MVKNLQDQQAGFRGVRSCIDQIATLCMIKEQSIEWNISFYVNFIDIERAFDSLHREILWRQLFHYGIFTKLIILIKDIYSDMKWQVVHGGNTNGEFEIKTTERQSTFLGFFVLVND